MVDCKFDFLVISLSHLNFEINKISDANPMSPQITITPIS